MLSFGWALKGQLGLPDPDARYARPAPGAAAAEDQPLPRALTLCLPGPGPPGPLPAVVWVAAGARHTVLVTADGRVFTCGDGRLGVLGYPAAGPQRLPRAVDGLPGPAASAAAGGFHTAVVLRDGGVATFGCNSAGQLGRPDEPAEWAGPGRMDGVEGAVAAACGAVSTLVVTAGGAVRACGSNTYGRHAPSAPLTSWPVGPGPGFMSRVRRYTRPE